MHACVLNIVDRLELLTKAKGSLRRYVRWSSETYHILYLFHSFYNG